MNNDQLKQKYDQMHAEGKQAWFDDGQEERQAIVKMGMPWTGKTVMEIGCGEGDLLDMLDQKRAVVRGCDYSLEAITTAKNRYPYLDVMCCDWTEYPDNSRRNTPDVIVMQGVLEHFDHPWASLDGIIEKFKPKTVITTMPSFCNIRGIVWHTLHMLNAVMSKTDLHFINHWDVAEYCKARNYDYHIQSVDIGWGNGQKMIRDMRKRIPLALDDGGLEWDVDRFDKFMRWLENVANTAFVLNNIVGGAVTIYRVEL